MARRGVIHSYSFIVLTCWLFWFFVFSSRQVLQEHGSLGDWELIPDRYAAHKGTGALQAASELHHGMGQGAQLSKDHCVDL